MAIGDEFKSSGITSNTPKNIMLGAGTIHKGLEYKTASNAWNFAESLICATNGGSKVSIKPEMYKVPVDGALVNVKGLTVKMGEAATMEINPVEVTPEFMELSTIGDSNASSTITGYSEITSKDAIATGDYVSNLAFVGKTIGGQPIIIIFDNALCTSGLDIESKNKEAATPKFTFECYADLDADADTLPWHIYYPTPSST